MRRGRSVDSPRRGVGPCLTVEVLWDLYGARLDVLSDTALAG